MTNESLVERNRQLERAVKRWRLVSFCLLLLLILVLAVGGLITTMPPTQEAGDFWLFLPWVRAAREKAAMEDAILAEQEALQALRAMEAQKRAVEAKAGPEAAKKEPEQEKLNDE